MQAGHDSGKSSQRDRHHHRGSCPRRRPQSRFEEAFALLIAQYHQPLYSLIARSLNDPADAADITQEVFIKVFRSIRGFHGEAVCAPGSIASLFARHPTSAAGGRATKGRRSPSTRPTRATLTTRAKASASVQHLPTTPIPLRPCCPGRSPRARRSRSPSAPRGLPYRRYPPRD